MFLGIVYMILHQLGIWYIPHEYILSMEFRQQFFLKRVFIIGLWGHVNLYKYVSCWLLAEGVRIQIYKNILLFIYYYNHMHKCILFIFLFKYVMIIVDMNIN